MINQKQFIMEYLKYFPFVVIVTVALLLRIVNLSMVPPGFSDNEASTGYNAYSILKTGKDEYGQPFPLIFKSFGDYKLGLPVYLTSASILIGGLNEFFVRLPAALVGTASVVVIFFLANQLFKNLASASMTSLLLTLSPWHVQLSRYDTPVSLSIFLLITQLLVILSDIKFRSKLLILLIIQALVLLTHPAAWVVSLPLTILWLSKNFSQVRDKSVNIVFILIIAVALLGVVTRQSINHFYFDNSFYKEVGFTNRVNQLRGYVSSSPFKFTGAFFQNKYIIFSDQVSKNYLKGFDFYNLFLESNAPETNFVSGFGKFYSIELIFFFLGVYYVLKKPIPGNYVIFLLLLLSPLPGVLNLKPDFGQSLFFLIIPFYLFTALGFVQLWKSITILPAKIGFGIASFLVFILGAIVFFHYYFHHYSANSVLNWNFGYKQISEKVNKLYPNYQNIIITDRLSSKPYVLLLFFDKVDPNFYQKTNKQRGGSKFYSTYAFDKYQFRSIDWTKEEKRSGTLFVGFGDEIPGYNSVCENVSPSCKEYVDHILYSDGKIAYKIVGIKQ